jgi:hypothetical protein
MTKSLIARFTTKPETARKAKKIKSYDLYMDMPNGSITNKSEAYSKGTHKWIVYVRARSIREAYFLAANQKGSRDGSVGITRIDHKYSPQVDWPWKLPKETYAEWLHWGEEQKQSGGRPAKARTVNSLSIKRAQGARRST